MDTSTAARRWAETWQRAWEEGEVEPIAALYHPAGTYSTEPFRNPYRGPAGARQYISQAFAADSGVRARFGEPLVDRDRAAVQWWAALTEQGQEVTLAGTSVLHFDEDGLVLGEWDTWNMAEGRRQPPPGWVE